MGKIIIKFLKGHCPFIFIIFLNTNLISQSLVFKNIYEKKLTNHDISYSIKAQKRVFKEANVVNFLVNKHKFVMQNLYYENGSFIKKNVFIEFKKAYWLEGKFYMKECNGVLEEAMFKSKEAIYENENLIFKNIFYQKDNKYFSNYKYQYHFKNN